MLVQKIKDASVQLVAWNKMRLNIEENPAIGYYQNDDKTYELLADGQIIEVESDATPKDYPLLTLFTEDTQFQALAKQLEKVPASVIREIDRGFSIQTIQKITKRFI